MIIICNKLFIKKLYILFFIHNFHPKNVHYPDWYFTFHKCWSDITFWEWNNALGMKHSFFLITDKKALFSIMLPGIFYKWNIGVLKWQDQLCGFKPPLGQAIISVSKKLYPSAKNWLFPGTYKRVFK
jgi:hypothetical protein